MQNKEAIIVKRSNPFSFADDALKEDFSRVCIQLEISTQVGQEDAISMDSRGIQNESEFLSNMWAWNQDTGLRSVDNYKSTYFDAIVDMKEDAVPYIYRELLKGPTPLVHALDRIYEGEVEYGGYLPLEFVCNVWLEILKKKGMLV